jgi:hypothetical protein
VFCGLGAQSNIRTHDDAGLACKVRAYHRFNLPKLVEKCELRDASKNSGVSRLGDLLFPIITAVEP